MSSRPYSSATATGMSPILPRSRSPNAPHRLSRCDRSVGRKGHMARALLKKEKCVSESLAHRSAAASRSPPRSHQRVGRSVDDLDLSPRRTRQDPTPLVHVYKALASRCARSVSGHHAGVREDVRRTPIQRSGWTTNGRSAASSTGRTRPPRRPGRRRGWRLLPRRCVWDTLTCRDCQS